MCRGCVWKYLDFAYELVTPDPLGMSAIRN